MDSVSLQTAPEQTAAAGRMVKVIVAVFVPLTGAVTTPSMVSDSLPATPLTPLLPFVPSVPLVPFVPLLPLAPLVPSAPLAPAGPVSPLQPARASAAATRTTPDRFNKFVRIAFHPSQLVIATNARPH